MTELIDVGTEKSEVIGQINNINKSLLSPVLLKKRNLREYHHDSYDNRLNEKTSLGNKKYSQEDSVLHDKAQSKININNYLI